MCTVWHVDKYKIRFKLVINSRKSLAAQYRVAARRWINAGLQNI